MEEKRFGILSSLIDTIKAFAKRGKGQEGKDDEKITAADSELADKLRAESERKAAELLRSLSGGGTAGHMDSVLQIDVNEQGEEQVKPEQGEQEVADTNPERTNDYDRYR